MRRLYGIDPPGLDGGFAHNDAQLKERLEEFRRRCQVEPVLDEI